MADAKIIKVKIIRATIAQGQVQDIGAVLELDASEAATLLRLGKAEVFDGKAKVGKAVAPGGEQAVTN